MHRVEFTRLPSTIAEAGQHVQRIAIQDVHLLVGAARQINVLLLRIRRERDIHTAPSPSVFLYRIFSLTNVPSGLNTWMRFVHAVADIQQTVVGKIAAVHWIAKL